MPSLIQSAYRWLFSLFCIAGLFLPFSAKATIDDVGNFIKTEHADTGLHHAPGRVYDAALGRWLSADPYPDAELLPEGSERVMPL